MKRRTRAQNDNLVPQVNLDLPPPQRQSRATVKKRVGTNKIDVPTRPTSEQPQQCHRSRPRPITGATPCPPAQPQLSENNAVEVDNTEMLENDKKSRRARRSMGVKAYNAQQMSRALADVSAGMSIRKAAKVWSVPRTTLNDLKLGNYKQSRPGPCTVLTTDEENMLVEWLIEMSRRALPVSRDCLLDSIQAVLIGDPRANPFTDNRPGDTWFKLFLKRHPEIGQRHAESISRSRGALTEGCIRGWFKDVRDFFKNKNIEYVLDDPKRQFNGDETGFRIDPVSGRVLAPKCEPSYTESGGNKEQLTVLITTCADGSVLTPAIVYPYKKRIPKNIVDSVPSDFCIAMSDSGWMTSSVFF